MALIQKTRELEESYDIHPSPSEVKDTLWQILESAPFRTSKQCQDLLRYVVEQSLGGDDGSLRERVIGTSVFGRQPTYDTSEDPVVRVRAADVRKRLAQYYQALDSSAPRIHIELQPGSYRAHFRYDQSTRPTHPEIDIHTSEPPQPVALPAAPKVGRERAPLWRKALLLLTILLAVAGVGRWVKLQWLSPQAQFWAPVLSSKQPVLLYLGSNATYVFSEDYLARYRAAHNLPNNGPEIFVDLAPDAPIRASEIVPVPDTFVTVGDLAASVQLTTYLSDVKSPFVLRSGRDLSFGDLRNRPSVMIGGFNNRWTLELTNDLPYSFRHGTRIQDRDHPEHGWSVPSHTKSSTTDDYALVSRLLTSKTGGPVITVAGIGQFGTQAAAEFLSSPDRMRDLLKNAPPGWESKNMQAVFHIKVVGYEPVAVEVAATDYW